MNILIINAHSSKNKGDAGIVLSMIDSIEKNIPNAKIKIKTRFPEIDKHTYDVPVHECVANISVDPDESKVTKIKSALEMLKIIYSKNQRIDEDYEWADVVVSCGGGFLLSHRFSPALLQHLVQLKIAFDYNKPVVIYAQSIGPFYNNIMQKVSKRILDKVDNIFIRENISKTWLEKISCTNKNINVVSDSAFCMKDQQSDYVDQLFAELKKDHNGPIIGLTARDWNFPEMNDKALHRKKYVESMQQAIIHFENKYGAKVLLMPQVLGPNDFNDDRIISREILSGIVSKNSQLIDYDFNPRELKYFYSKLDMFIGTRMHSNIFSLSSYVPTVAINYEHKTRGIMELLELDEYVLEINHIEPNDLISVAEKCWENNASLRQELKIKIPDVLENAEIPAKYIAGLNKN
ncbi:polysaccharide pyruvyl transferase family protein [Metabacillus litoralis]|uniref:polysaccharide pyruvyl transferase family protein n=1 Tax=Metabacillus litoralis TaxID=152268 RepID=UPI0020400395|nr:polysaccharide pyruvyl transferase family protein [Metabacillus litoralis]MCM3652935.1 polysaccharide pyruvyl transferase family protein [Metabacillus litoralis]